jgi:hypothetical protein
MWESKDEEEELLEALIKALYWPIDSPVSSTLLAAQILEEMEAFFIMGKRYMKQHKQGQSTCACKTFMVLEVFKSKDEALQWDRDEQP